MEDREIPHDLLNKFMGVMIASDFTTAAREVMPYVHRSNYAANGVSLDRDLLDFSFKKAHENAKFYAHPVQVTRSQPLKDTEIGHPSRGTHQRGSSVNYFLAKKEGVEGMPAPLSVFFPDDGGAPTVAYMGSL